MLFRTTALAEVPMSAAAETAQTREIVVTDENGDSVTKSATVGRLAWGVAVKD